MSHRVEAEPMTEQPVEQPAPLPRRTSWLVIGAVNLALVMAVVGIIGWIRAAQIRDGSPADNRALIDAAATSQVIDAVSKGLDGVLSYDFSNPAPTEAAAQSVLTGEARKQQQTLFAELLRKAPGQQLVLTAQVEAAGVVRLEGERATLLVFVDQSSQRAKDKQASVSAAQLSVTAVRVAGQWKIADLSPM